MWDVEKAIEKVEELRKNLRHHQKFIKLADKSKAGWLTFKEYQTKELASDSEDLSRKSAQEEETKWPQKS